MAIDALACAACLLVDFVLASQRKRARLMSEPPLIAMMQGCSDLGLIGLQPPQIGQRVRYTEPRGRKDNGSIGSRDVFPSARSRGVRSYARNQFFMFASVDTIGAFPMSALTVAGIALWSPGTDCISWYRDVRFGAASVEQVHQPVSWSRREASVAAR